MRLCYLADPTSSHTAKWLKYFLHSGHEVHLMGWSPPTDPALGRAHYHHLPSELYQPFSRPVRSAIWHLGLWRLAQIRQMQVILEEIRPDILDILMLNADQLPAVMAWRGPLVITPWGHDLLVYPHHYNLTTRLWLRQALRRADLVLCNSQELIRAAQKLGARSNRIRRVGQIVDLRRFKPGLDSQGLAAKVGVAGGPILLSPRQLDPNYQIEVMIRALPDVLRTYPHACLLLLGKRNVDPAYVAALDSEIARLEVGQHVHFAGWFDNDEMPGLYALADVVLSIPISDSRPSSVFEAMACGVPVIVSDLMALREIVQMEETGLLVPLANEKSLSEAIVRILRDRELRAHITSQALDFVCREGDYETQMAKVAGYYDELLGR